MCTAVEHFPQSQSDHTGQMSTSHLHPTSATADTADNLYATVDMGTNSFKLLIVRVDPSTGLFLPINRHKDPVLLGIDSAAVISPAAINRAVAALTKFRDILLSYDMPLSRCRFVATSAVREASNQSEFLSCLRQHLDLQIEVLSGKDEARFVYLGVLQFLTAVDQTILTVDIGGGSTEFVIGCRGKILYSISLKLGHITLTQQFSEIAEMCKHVRSVIGDSGLVDKVKEYKIVRVIGSSGTIKAIERAVSKGYAKKKVGEINSCSNSDWKFNKDDLIELVESLQVEGQKREREEFFGKRAEFILSGAALLEQVFEALEISEMETSEYALAEGVVSEMLGKADNMLDVDVRWSSVVRLATRLCSNKKMKSAASCVLIAKDIFKGVRKWNVVDHELLKFLEDKDIEYLEAACLLNKIGLVAGLGKKKYHKKSYQIIINGNHLQGYSHEEMMLIGLLVKHHRKKLPKADDTLFDGSAEKVKHKFTMLCAILRLSVCIEQLQTVDSPRYKFSPDGFRLELAEGGNHPISNGIVQPLAEMVKEELGAEVENFKMVFKKSLSVVVR